MFCKKISSIFVWDICLTIFGWETIIYFNYISNEQNMVLKGNLTEVNNMVAHISNDGLNREESVAEHTEKARFLCNEKGKRCGLSHLMSLCGKK